MSSAQFGGCTIRSERGGVGLLRGRWALVAVAALFVTMGFLVFLIVPFRVHQSPPAPFVVTIAHWIGGFLLLYSVRLFRVVRACPEVLQGFTAGRVGPSPRRRASLFWTIPAAPLLVLFIAVLVGDLELDFLGHGIRIWTERPGERIATRGDDWRFGTLCVPAPGHHLCIRPY
jgi:hypothetical protein